MKHLRLTVRPDPERAPPFLEFLLRSPDVAIAHAVDWNRGDSESSTHLYAIDGDAVGFADTAAATDGVDAVERAAGDGSVSHVLLELRDEAVPIFGGAAEAIDRAGLVVRRPLVYRDGRIDGHAVGDPSVLQATLEEVPDAVDVQVDAIGRYPSASVNPATALSDRQAEAIETALELGYYDAPRGATHEDVAAEMGCAANTASRHLQLGEAKLVRAGMDAFGTARER